MATAIVVGFSISGKGFSENLWEKHLQASHFPCTATDNKLQYPPFLPVAS
ncbi:hypothetical protein VB774_20275 [Pseudanabaena galeata UHCC 0370]|uniref:Beta-ketoacyl synthase N-terminal domain-containing protein n=1 Tax=Pseudanabaena galeata UHCC 0370 TaxID=3110310 RepID=A0ABU5TNT6_9CYAN|nr:MULTISPECIES: hypothetical protein [Pseudanabaena]MEA5479971.1 hypothetical protein [Pseudanabaena galeata UHCC 0370]MEA5486907.1 hypothetical protein [Pseudanabaena sp. CCNP1317]WGS72231.1 hypothetical protein OA858_21380 [Pseudanabaena galeata CCNP1313]